MELRYLFLIYLLNKYNSIQTISLYVISLDLSESYPVFMLFKKLHHHFYYFFPSMQGAYLLIFWYQVKIFTQIPNARFYENQNIFHFITEPCIVAFDNTCMPWPMVMSSIGLTYIIQEMRMTLCTRTRNEELRVQTD